jgi:hypothetical protein
MSVKVGKPSGSASRDEASTRHAYRRQHCRDRHHLGDRRRDHPHRRPLHVGSEGLFLLIVLLGGGTHTCAAG